MTSAYRAVAHTIAGCVLLQATFIAWAMFGLRHDLDDGATVTKDYDGNAGWVLHGVFGSLIIPLLAIALLVVALRLKRPDATRFAAILLGMVIVQAVLGYVGEAAPIVGALHGALALGIMGISVIAGTRIGRSAPATG